MANREEEEGEGQVNGNADAANKEPEDIWISLDFQLPALLFKGDKHEKTIDKEIQEAYEKEQEL